MAGGLWVNSVTSSISDIISRPIGLVLYRYFSAKKVIIIFFTISLIGSIPVCFGEVGGDNYRKYVVPAFLFITNFGTTGNFGNLYIGHLDFFPNIFSGSTIGFCNTLARFVTIFAPVYAVLPQPVPEITIAALCAIAITLGFFVRPKTDKYF